MSHRRIFQLKHRDFSLHCKTIWIFSFKYFHFAVSLDVKQNKTKSIIRRGNSQSKQPISSHYICSFRQFILVYHVANNNNNYFQLTKEWKNSTCWLVLVVIVKLWFSVLVTYYHSSKGNTWWSHFEPPEAPKMHCINGYNTSKYDSYNLNFPIITHLMNCCWGATNGNQG